MQLVTVGQNMFALFALFYNDLNFPAFCVLKVKEIIFLHKKIQC